MPPRRLRRALDAARPTLLEQNAAVTAVLLVVVALVVLVGTGDVDGAARFLGTAGLAFAAVGGSSIGVRAFHATAAGALPRRVGRTAVRARPQRAVTAATVVLALVVPAVAVVALLARVAWAWPLVAGVLVLGCSAAVAARLADDDDPWSLVSDRPSEVLARLCMVADLPVPELVVQPGGAANAWTTRGRIHLTWETLDLLGDTELEAILAHELAHLAHGDAAVMDVCSAPSRVLLGFSGLVRSRIGVWLRVSAHAHPAVSVAVAGLAAACVPVALGLGWLSRLSVLALSRSRELSADAAAAALTGRPAALASALLKLDGDQASIPQTDLRRIGARAVLCVVGSGPRTGLRRLLATHPPTALRVERLHALERRAHA